MPSVWFSAEGARLKSYSSASKGRRATVKIEIEVTDIGYLGYLLEELARCEHEQNSPPTPYRPQPKSADERELGRRLRAERPLALPAPSTGGGR